MKFVVFISCIASVAVAYANGFIFHTSFDDWSDDSEYYNIRAVSLIQNGTLNEQAAMFRRPPAYSLFLASVYSVLGQRIVSVWIAHMVLFCILLYLLWRISSEFLSAHFALAPPLLAGSYWGLNFYVFEIGSDLFAAMLTLTLAFLFLQYQKNPRLSYLVLFAILAGILALTKPVVVYALPVLAVLLVWQRASWRTSLAQLGVVLGIAALFVGGWVARTYVIFGEAQIERAGHIVYTRGLYGTLAWRDIGSHLLASVTGDYVAGLVMDGYGEAPVPQRLGRIQKLEFARLRQEGNDIARTEQILFEKGVQQIMAHPVKFIAGTLPLLFDLNMPENGKGFSISRMFVGTHQNIPAWMKILLLLSVRIVWFGFLALVVLGMVDLATRSPSTSALALIFLAVYFNIAHALLIIPQEPRFLVPVLLLYFLFLTKGIEKVLYRYHESGNPMRWAGNAPAGRDGI